MASKSLLFVCILVIALSSSPTHAQLGGLLGLIRIKGTIFCTLNGGIGSRGTATPVFSNAAVQLQCGASKSVVSSAITDSTGVFSILLDPLTLLVSSLLSDCKLAVTTPLSTCDASLSPAGILQAPLQLIGKTLEGLLGIVNLGPGSFSFIPSLD